jgi:xylulokinase
LPEYLLGIDVGTTSCKTALFDIDGRLIVKVSKEYDVLYPKPTWAEQDADIWWNAVRSNLRTIMRKMGKRSQRIIGVGIDSQREAVVPLDARGRKLANSLIWLDRRTIPQSRRIPKLIRPAKIIRTTGVPVDYFYSATKIMWLRDERPDIFGETKCFLFPKDYIGYKLTGKRATDYSMASRTMLFDIRKRKWSDEICENLKIPIDLLPPTIESSQVLGEVSLEGSAATGLRLGTPVVCGGGDRPVEAVGAGVAEPGCFNIGTGTATAITTPLTSPKVDVKGRIDCCCHAIPKMWEYEAVISATGASFRWFRDNFSSEEKQKGMRTGVDPYEYLTRLARKTEPGSDGLFYYPYPMGATAPKFDATARAVFYGLTLTHTRAHFVRSIFEGIAFQYAECIELLEELGLKVKEASIVGGEARSELWNQIKADIISRPIKQPTVEDAACLGSAILSSVGAGAYGTVSKAMKNMVRIERTFKPRHKEKQVYSKIYDKYRKVYQIIEVGFKILTY